MNKLMPPRFMEKDSENPEKYIEIPSNKPWMLEKPRDKKFGDWSCNIALVNAYIFKQSPRQVAQTIVKNLNIPEGMIRQVEIAGPGFINFYINPNYWPSILPEINAKGSNYGTLTLGQGQKVQVEFVSANPTGPLHVGHGRGAATGDSLANLLAKAGFEVQREYYTNDAGNQINLLGTSVYLRYKELLGQSITFIENGYKGDYIRDIAQEIIAKDADKWLDVPDLEGIAFCGKYAGDKILEEIRLDLLRFNVKFDRWFSERSLYTQGEVDKAIEQMRQTGHIILRDGAWWLVSTGYGDEKDRVVIRQTGEPTYLASDIAYHWDKIQRGFNKIIDIWGADHHGYVARIFAAVQAMNYPASNLEVILIQLVRLLRDGVPVAMSTRQAEYVTLEEVVAEVGKDAARFFFMTRRHDSQLDFDLELAKKQSAENPVYYVQYAHARICSVFAKAAEAKIDFPSSDEADLSLLNLEPELELMQKLAEFPSLVAGAARAREPHRFTFYCRDLAALLHRYYNKHRIADKDNLKLSQARLFLVNAVKIVLAESLRILGVSAPENMKYQEGVE
ncbi:MAG: arginine--tRNA ligase [Candidatus Schekmanbacteria bacterium]|nr:arginine--tRNA ligase [Candidatus Schekmanbacteria bacterium]